jgi:hypothetical protein
MQILNDQATSKNQELVQERLTNQTLSHVLHTAKGDAVASKTEYLAAVQENSVFRGEYVEAMKSEQQEHQ